MFYYIIYDRRVNDYVCNRNGYAMSFATIKDCVDYLILILNVDYEDLSFYDFELKKIAI